MKPEELQVGDWVLWKNKPVQIAQISGIKYSFGHIDVVLAHCNDDNLLESHDIKSISPIAITPEILLMNGFEKDETHISTDFELVMDGINVFIVIFIDGDIVLDIETKSKSMIGQNTIHNSDIRYIHQLQNMMRICGIDKEIKL